MVERFLLDIYNRVRRNKVAIFISSDLINDKFVELLPRIRAKVKDLGDLKISTILYDGDLPERYFQSFQNAGFSHKILTSHEELRFLIEVYDQFLREGIDVLILGTKSDALIPMYTEIRKKATIYALVADNETSDGFKESFDGIILMDKLDEYSFNGSDFSEYSIDGSTFVTNEIIETEDFANIGTTSERIEEMNDKIRD